MKKVILLLILYLTALSVETLAQVVKIKMTKSKGTYEVPCTVNGLQLNFVFDTGATFVSISKATANYMLENDYLSEGDYYSHVKIRQADGSSYIADKVKLREINISGFILKDVDAIITPSQNAPLLLGLSAIKKLGKVSIKDDFLIVENSTVNYTGIEEDIAFLGLTRGTSYDECEEKLIRKFGENKVLHSSINDHAAYILEVENEVFINKKFDFISLYFDDDNQLASAEASKFFPLNELSKALRFRDDVYTYLKRKYKATKRIVSKKSKLDYYVLGYTTKNNENMYPIKVEITKSITRIAHTDAETELLEGYSVYIYYWPAAINKIVNDYVHEDEY